MRRPSLWRLSLAPLLVAAAVDCEAPNAQSAQNAQVTERPSASASHAAAAPAALGDTVLYFLVRVDGTALPYREVNELEKCGEGVLAGRYEITGSRWVAVDSIERGCKPALLERYEGKLTRTGARWRMTRLDPRLGELDFDRGRLVGDTLFTRGEDYGPERVYVRRR